MVFKPNENNIVRKISMYKNHRGLYKELVEKAYMFTISQVNILHLHTLLSAIEDTGTSASSSLDRCSLCYSTIVTDWERRLNDTVTVLFLLCFLNIITFLLLETLVTVYININLDSRLT